eukprot:2524879-Rhodomonas_salina.1
MQAINNAQHQPPAGSSCYNCNKVGHIRPECPHPIKNPLLPLPNRFAPGGRGALLGRGGMVVACGARPLGALLGWGGMGVASGASGGMRVALEEWGLPVGPVEEWGLPVGPLTHMLCPSDNVNTAGISPMPSGPSPPRPELLVTLEAHTDVPPPISSSSTP